MFFLGKCDRTVAKPWLWTEKNKQTEGTSSAMFGVTTAAKCCEFKRCAERVRSRTQDKDEPSDRRGAVYKIKCCDCQATYICETGRNLNVRLNEHKRGTRSGDINNHIAEHHLKTNNRIDWDSAECVTYSTDYRLSTNHSGKLVY